jgi:hypothetical protein
MGRPTNPDLTGMTSAQIINMVRQGVEKVGWKLDDCVMHAVTNCFPHATDDEIKTRYIVGLVQALLGLNQLEAAHNEMRRHEAEVLTDRYAAPYTTPLAS